MGKEQPEEAVKERMDVYVRLNGDPEKDYCLTLPRDLKVGELQQLLARIPVQLSPSYFYIGDTNSFAASVNPGYLTAEGAILFTEQADDAEWLKPLDNSKTLAESVSEGQLIVPRWPWSVRRHIGVVCLLMFWLYLDLPAYYSPTPWTAPTANMLKLVAYVIPNMDDILPRDDSYFNGKWWQILFFALHTVKVLFIYFILRIGAWHPASFNVLKARSARKAKKLPTREELVALGWTGSKRLSSSDWFEKYRDYRIKRAGGVLKAFREGLIDKQIGIYLNKGEGWNTLAKCDPAHLPKVDRNFLDADNKFPVSERYFDALCQPIAAVLQDDTIPLADRMDKLKQFRNIGYMDGPEDLCELFDALIPSHPEPKRN